MMANSSTRSVWTSVGSLAGGVMVAVVVVAGAATALAAPWTRSACLWSDAICDGVRVGGVALQPSDDVAETLRPRDRELASRKVVVTLEGRPSGQQTLTLGELGVHVDIPKTTALLTEIGHRGAYADRLALAEQAAAGKIDVPLVIDVDEATAMRALLPIKDATDELPVPARIDLARGGVVPHVAGRFLDLAASLDRIRAAAMAKEDSVSLPRLSIDPRVSSDFLSRVDTKKPLARFQTGFSRRGDQATRAQNIDTAAARLDGVVLLPHELFSFNQAVGPRTVDNGFARGWEIFKGEMVEGIGGGTCQVASTFHAAAFLAGLDVIERIPHSRPSAYITMGLDATVVYPVVDLKIRNPYDFPVVVHSSIEGSTVIFELLGQDRPARVLFKREIVATRPFPRKIEEKKGLPRGRIFRRQHGIPGYKIKRTRMIAYSDGTGRKEENVDVYWPTFELYQVAPGVDPEPLLPPPSDGQEEPGNAGWAAAPDPDSVDEAPEATPAAVAPTVPPTPAAVAASGDTAPPCEGDCPPPRPKVFEAPGVHAPHAVQMRAPAKVVIGSAPLRP